MDLVLRAGIDVGSTTIKLVVLSAEGDLLFHQYRRHNCHIQKTMETMLEEAARCFPYSPVRLAFTGMGGMELAELWAVPFIQELTAETQAIQAFDQSVAVAIELGGEDAKIIYFHKDAAPDQRMNRDCAGGTGAFLDYLAVLLGTDAAGLDQLAAKGRHIYPIAARCGVFAQTDVQGLLNEGADREDIALSVFQAIVNQALSGLARGTPIHRRIVFLGGPLTFMPVLRKQFIATLHLSEEECLLPEHGELYAAMGAALCAEGHTVLFSDKQTQIAGSQLLQKSAPVIKGLFASAEEYQAFVKSHDVDQVPSAALLEHMGAVWLGVDAGSTTMKAVLINQAGAVLSSWYRKNGGDVLKTAKAMFSDIYDVLPEGVYIAGTGVTGYGEELLKKAFCIDLGEVETVAHVQGAKFFCPQMTALLDIGGQDMKYCRLQEGIISKISLNNACASGCGAFLESFAETLHMDIATFAEKACLARTSIDLGSHCTVLMNSRVKQVQKDGIDMGVLAAGLCMSVVKNALYKVVKLTNADELGEHIVVEGGTFCNDAVLRAFENILGCKVIRPNIAGLMGAYGMALKVRETFAVSHRSTLIGQKDINQLTAISQNRRCKGCGNRCLVSMKRFSNGMVYVTGNRCEQGELLMLGRRGLAGEASIPDGYRWMKDHVFQLFPSEKPNRGTVGIPAVLNMWSDFPYWSAFFTALGYRVIKSEFTEKAIGATVATIPEDVHCYACTLAHVHLWDLLQKKPDFIWMPVRGRGREEPEVDEMRHAVYGNILAEAMREEIMASGISFLHPQLPEAKDPFMAQILASVFPDLPLEEIKSAVRLAEKAQNSYYEGLWNETKRTLAWIQKKNCTAFILCGRPYQADPQIHKGIPRLITALGVPVLSGEGLMLINRPDGPCLDTAERTLRDNLLGALPFAQREESFQLIQLQPVGCGYDGLTIHEMQKALGEKGKPYTILNLDQGFNAGAIRIRLRSLLAETEELKRHPEAKRILAKQTTRAVSEEKSFWMPPFSHIYDVLLQAAFQGEGYDMKMLPFSGDAESPAILDGTGTVVQIAVSSLMKEAKKIKEIPPLLILSDAYDAAMVGENIKAAGLQARVSYFDCGRGKGQVPVTVSLLHRFFPALFLGDMLLRCLLAVRYQEQDTRSAEALVGHFLCDCCQTVQSGTFGAYEVMLDSITQAFAQIPVKGTKGIPIGVEGNPFLILRSEVFPARLIEKEGGRVLLQGLGEWYANELMEIFRGISFAENRKVAEICMAAKNTCMAYMKVFADAVGRAGFLDPVSDEKTKRIAMIRRLSQGSDLTEAQRDFLRRGARGMIFITELSVFDNGNGASHKVMQVKYPEIPILTEEYFQGKSAVNRENRIKLFMNQVKATIKRDSTKYK